MPLYFDLGADGAAADPAARAFVVAARPTLGEGSVRTPAVLLMTSDGEVVGELDPFLAPSEFLAGMHSVLAARPAFAQLSEAERALTDPLARAELALDLGDLAAARALLDAAPGARARLLEGHAARLQGDRAAMEAELARVDDPDLAEDVLAERVQAAWAANDLAGVCRLTEHVSRSSSRAAELWYLRGLALYHLGAQQEALAAWRSAVEGRGQDAWVYRADWAWTEVSDGMGAGLVSRARPSSSLLGRIGYLGRGNPDLLAR